VKDILFISLGAIFGANTRFIIYNKLESYNLSKGYIISVINTLSSFFLGLFCSFLPKYSSYDFSYHLLLFLSIGFLGSLSTFSTFIYDLFDLTSQFKLFKALKLYIISISLGVIAFTIGFF